MDTERIVYQVIRLLGDIHAEASQAYWKSETNCGSDYSPVGCDGCKHVVRCEQSLAIDKELGYLGKLVSEEIRKEVDNAIDSQSVSNQTAL